MRKLANIFVMMLVLATSATSWSAVIDFTGGGGLFSASASPNEAIPDYPGAGLAYALSFNDVAYSEITAISVTLTISGGWNGDLYAYLSHGSGFGVLLNRVGANALGEDGYSTAGFNNVTLTTSGTDIHTVQNPTTGGSYASDGRIAYTSGTRDNTLGVFLGGNPNGAWTLYFGDEASGNISTLASWEVDITAVPEPTNIALGIFAAGLLAFSGARTLGKKLKIES
jgi:subtilisin-like proprotein convertase family protein